MTDDDARHELDDLIDLAPLAALDALPDLERVGLARRVDSAGSDARTEFDGHVRAVHEAMAQVSEATAEAPPTALRDRILAGAAATTDHENPTSAGARTSTRRERRTRWALAAAAVAVVVGVGGGAIGYTLSNRPPPSTSMAEKVMSAPDVQTAAGPVATGRASVMYSPKVDAGVLVMNDVPPPPDGRIYQMWLVGPSGPRLAGVMTDKDVSPSTTAVVDDLGDATSLAFTVGDPDRSTEMLSPPVAEIPLS